jgi:hypothetical protein
MTEETCISCRRPKAIHLCGICKESICKNCSQFLAAGTFSFLRTLPEQLSHSYYCANCYDQHVSPALESYNEKMERARNLYFFFITQRKPIPMIKKSKETLRVEECDDRDETILRLAFLAIESGYNSVVEAEITSKKVRNEGWVKAVWQGIGVAANIDVERFERSISRHK